MTKSYCCALILIASSLGSVAQTAPPTADKILAKGYYVVIAAFSPEHEDYAIRLSTSLNKEGRQTRYGFESTRKYWYVYTNRFVDYDESVTQMFKVRKERMFADAWTHTIKDGSEQTVAKTELQEQTTNQEVVKTTVKTEEPIVEEKKPEEKKPEPVVTEVVENPPAQPVYLPQTLNNTPVFLSLYNSTNNEVIDGEVEVINAETSKLITRVKGNTYLTLPNPKTKSGRLVLISNTFGYRKEQLEMNYKDTEADTLKKYVALVGNFYMINFGLVRIRKGDISTLYNIYFFNDAAIMLPDSKYQLNSLLQLMNESPNMKIILHGHTNGGSRGKIISMGPSKEFFSITKDVVNGSGSAKELSAARAEIIRQWLISQGVADSRISVKGWGGSRMIHDKNSTFARKNIRVDVEVAED